MRRRWSGALHCFAAVDLLFDQGESRSALGGFFLSLAVRSRDLNLLAGLCSGGRPATPPAGRPIRLRQQNWWFGMSQAQRGRRRGWTGGLILGLIAFIALLGSLSKLLGEPLDFLLWYLIGGTTTD